MLELSENNNRVSISKEFFCDGHCYVMTSSSFGGSGITAFELSNILFNPDGNNITELLNKGVCFPVCFDGDCALDGNTNFVLGELNEQEERDWIARLAWKLNIPCGKLILCCGCGDDDLEHAVSGRPPDKHYVIFETIEIPPAEYLVEIYAFFSSMTVQVRLDDYDEDEYDPEDLATFELDENFHQAKAKYQWYQKNRPGLEDVGYVIRLKPLESEPSMPKHDSGWFEEFEFRPIDI